MQQIDAPDIRYPALINDHDEGDKEMPMDEYNQNAFRNAVVLGQHPDGDSLSTDMSRWKMSDAGLLSFLKTLH